MNTRKSEVYQQWEDGFVVRRMLQDEGEQVIKWCGALTTISCDIQVALDAREEDTDGYYVGELNGRMVSSMVEIPVADDVRYVGCVYVDEQHRKSGFARRMITTARDIGNCHNHTSLIALDTHPYLESMYEKFDYKTASKSADYQGTVSACIDLNNFGTNVRQVLGYRCYLALYFAGFGLQALLVLCEIQCVISGVFGLCCCNVCFVHFYIFLSYSENYFATEMVLMCRSLSKKTYINEYRRFTHTSNNSC